LFFIVMFRTREPRSASRTGIKTDSWGGPVCPNETGIHSQFEERKCSGQRAVNGHSSSASKMFRSKAGRSMFKLCFSRIHHSGLCFCAVVILSLFLAGCGSGSGGNAPTPAGDFSLSASPSNLTLEAGGNQTVTVSAAEINTFTASISVSVSGLPSGVTANPATFGLMPGNQQQLTVTAAGSAQPVTATITFQGTSGSLSHSADISLASCGGNRASRTT
jgi:hypothetical protein